MRLPTAWSMQIHCAEFSGSSWLVVHTFRRNTGNTICLDLLMRCQFYLNVHHFFVERSPLSTPPRFTVPTLPNTPKTKLIHKPQSLDQRYNKYTSMPKAKEFFIVSCRATNKISICASPFKHPPHPHSKTPHLNLRFCASSIAFCALGAVSLFQPCSCLSSSCFTHNIYIYTYMSIYQNRL